MNPSRLTMLDELWNGVESMKMRNPFWSKERRRELRRTMTLAERLLWKEIHKHSFKIKLVRQAGLGPFIVDFLHKPTRLVIELDGDIHLDPRQKQHDAIRTTWLESQGYQLLRFRNDQLYKDITRVIVKIECAIRSLLSNHNEPPPPACGRGQGVGRS